MPSCNVSQSGWQWFQCWYHPPSLCIWSRSLWPNGNSSPLLQIIKHQTLHNAKHLLLSQVDNGIRKKQNRSQCCVYLTRWLLGEQVFMESHPVFKLQAQFTPKQILNCPFRKTFHKMITLPWTSLRRHKHIPPHPSRCSPLPLKEKNASSVFIPKSNKNILATF